MKNHESQRGSASTKLLIVAVVIVLLANAGYQYVPVAYTGENMKQEMQTAVVQVNALPTQGKDPVVLMKERIRQLTLSNGLPPDTVIESKNFKGVIDARVRYSQSIPILPFGIYTHKYEFDHTAVPASFIGKSS